MVATAARTAIGAYSWTIWTKEFMGLLPRSAERDGQEASIRRGSAHGKENPDAATDVEGKRQVRRARLRRRRTRRPALFLLFPPESLGLNRLVCYSPVNVPATPAAGSGCHPAQTPGVRTL